jgi:hypothetical protein
MADAKPERVKPREAAEVDVQANMDVDGNARRRTYRTKQFNYRCTTEKYELLKRLAASLSNGRPQQRASWIETIDRALEALERELKGTKP